MITSGMTQQVLLWYWPGHVHGPRRCGYFGMLLLAHSHTLHDEVTAMRPSAVCVQRRGGEGYRVTGLPVSPPQPGSSTSRTNSARKPPCVSVPATGTVRLHTILRGFFRSARVTSHTQLTVTGNSARVSLAARKANTLSTARIARASSCAVTTNNAPLETRIGFGGYPIGQLPNRTPKGKGTIAWQKSGRQREGAEIADPQDLHDVVKAVLLQAQFQVGNTSTHRHSA